MSVNASNLRREGRRAFCPGLDAVEECPYTDTWKRECWLTGWAQELNDYDEDTPEKDRECYYCGQENCDCDLL